jgi:hypothetical protein
VGRLFELANAGVFSVNQSRSDDAAEGGDAFMDSEEEEDVVLLQPPPGSSAPARGKDPSASSLARHDTALHDGEGSDPRGVEAVPRTYMVGVGGGQ